MVKKLIKQIIFKVDIETFNLFKSTFNVNGEMSDWLREQVTNKINELKPTTTTTRSNKEISKLL